MGMDIGKAEQAEKIERIFAADMQSAMKQIRRELGDDAVIMSTRKLADGVEVSVSGGVKQTVRSVKPVRADARTRNRMNAPAGRSTPFHSEQVKAVETEPFQLGDDFRSNRLPNSADRAGQPFQALNEPSLQAELGSIRMLLQRCLGNFAWDEYSSKSPQNASLWQRFIGMGISGELTRSILDRLSADQDLKTAWRRALTQLSRAIPIASPHDLVSSGGTFAFLGATGVGKTTTIGKLATRYVLERGADSVALVTTDRFRVAAQEQLRSLGSILGVTVRMVDEHNSLSDILISLRNKSLVLIDTAGLNGADPNFQKQMQMLRDNSIRLRNLLVLSSTSQKQVLQQEYQAYAKVDLAASIVTKVDEAASIGAYLSLVVEKKLPVAYETHGQEIPDDIGVAEGVHLVTTAVELTRHAQKDTEQLVSEFSSSYQGISNSSTGSYAGLS